MKPFVFCSECPPEVVGLLEDTKYFLWWNIQPYGIMMDNREVHLWRHEDYPLGEVRWTHGAIMMVHYIKRSLSWRSWGVYEEYDPPHLLGPKVHWAKLCDTDVETERFAASSYRPPDLVIAWLKVAKSARDLAVSMGPDYPNYETEKLWGVLK